MAHNEQSGQLNARPDDDRTWGVRDSKDGWVGFMSNSRESAEVLTGPGRVLVYDRAGKWVRALDDYEYKKQR